MRIIEKIVDLIMIFLVIFLITEICTSVFADRIEDLTAENQQIDQRILEEQTKINESQAEINRLTQIKIFNFGRIEERKLILEVENEKDTPDTPVSAD